MKLISRSILLLSIFQKNLARKNILKARIEEPKNETHDPKDLKEEAKKQIVEILTDGEAYDEYDYDDEYEDRFDPWDLEDNELESRLRKLVSRMDNNNDGKITELELVIWTFKSLHAIDQKENAKDDFDDMDEDEDNYATWQEFIEDEYGEFSDEDGNPLKKSSDSDEINNEMYDIDFNRQYNRVKTRFDICDKDKNGKLDLEEFMLFKNPFSDEYVKDKWLESVLKILDSNENGMLEKAEFNVDWQRIPRNYEVIREKIDRNETLNLDDSGLRQMYEVIQKEDEIFVNYWGGGICVFSDG